MKNWHGLEIINLCILYLHMVDYGWFGDLRMKNSYLTEHFTHIYTVCSYNVTELIVMSCTCRVVWQSI